MYRKEAVNKRISFFTASKIARQDLRFSMKMMFAADSLPHVQPVYYGQS